MTKALTTSDPGNHRRRKSLRDQSGALLNVKLEISADLIRLDAGQSKEPTEPHRLLGQEPKCLNRQRFRSLAAALRSLDHDLIFAFP